MAKAIKALLKLQIPGGGATPAPPVGSALGQYGVNIMDFVQAFNNAKEKLYLLKLQSMKIIPLHSLLRQHPLLI